MNQSPISTGQKESPQTGRPDPDHTFPQWQRFYHPTEKCPPHNETAFDSRCPDHPLPQCGHCIRSADTRHNDFQTLPEKGSLPDARTVLHFLQIRQLCSQSHVLYPKIRSVPSNRPLSGRPLQMLHHKGVLT